MEVRSLCHISPPRKLGWRTERLLNRKEAILHKKKPIFYFSCVHNISSNDQAHDLVVAHAGYFTVPDREGRVIHAVGIKELCCLL